MYMQVLDQHKNFSKQFENNNKCPFIFFWNHLQGELDELSWTQVDHLFDPSLSSHLWNLESGITWADNCFQTEKILFGANTFSAEGRGTRLTIRSQPNNKSDYLINLINETSRRKSLQKCGTQSRKGAADCPGTEKQLILFVSLFCSQHRQVSHLTSCASPIGSGLGKLTTASQARSST